MGDIRTVGSSGEKLPDFLTHTHDPGLQSGSLVRFKTVDDTISNIPANFPNHEPERAIRRPGPGYDGDTPPRHCITTSGGGNLHLSGERETSCIENSLASKASRPSTGSDP